MNLPNNWGCGRDMGYDGARLGAVFSLVSIYGVELRWALVALLALSGARPTKAGPNPTSAPFRRPDKLLIPTERSFRSSLLSGVIHVH
jgi:hypothetical protein